ncbi:MAG: response regulator [Proteobacteria bacterium]|nr:response regulator [Pseudomonadota bacterium]MBU1709184.1 response regulator [Pseudomonadota bacterium]
MNQTEPEPKKIMIVDDNKDSRELALKVLQARGYIISEAVDGEDALAKIPLIKPDLILMDISLPKIDGYEVTRRLKNNPEFRNTPIIALTAHAMKGDREKALDAGCDGYIPKPINVRELPEQIRLFL